VQQAEYSGGLIADHISLSDNNSANPRASGSSYCLASISLNGKINYSGLLEKPSDSPA